MKQKVKRALRYIGHLFATASVTLVVQTLVRSVILPFLRRPATVLNATATVVADSTVGAI